MEFRIKDTEELLRARGLQKGGKVQKFIDSECIRHMDPYTPKRSGDLIKSAILGTVIGSGIIRQNIPYARSNYYGNKGRGLQGTANGGLRGKKWFERMKAVWLENILAGAAERAGARYKKRG